MYRKAWMMWLAVVFPISACSDKPSDKEGVTVREMTTGMRTWGIGRHLVDLPDSWRYGGGSDVTLYYGLDSNFETVDVQVIAEGVTKEVFDAALEDRCNRIRTVVNGATGGSMLVSRQTIAVNSELLRFFYDKTRDNYHRHEVHLLVNDAYVVLSADSYKNVIEPVESRLKELATQVDKVMVPERVGAGFALGPIIIRSAHDHEDGTLYFYDSERRDVRIEIGISAVTRDEDDRLNQRFVRDMDAFGVSEGAVLRKRDFTIAGMHGEETLIGYDPSAPDDGKSQRELLFVAESYRSNPGFMWPTFSIRMNTGGKRIPVYGEADPAELAMVRIPSFARPFDFFDSEPGREGPISSSLTDHEAMGVWDAILKSVRPRAGAVARPPERVSNVRIDPAELDAQRKLLDAWLAEVPDHQEDQTLARRSPPASERHTVAASYMGSQQGEGDNRSLIDLLNSHRRRPEDIG